MIMNRIIWDVVVCVTLAGHVIACSGDASVAEDSAGPAGVGIGGAQDFGAFRETVDNGTIPLPETLNDVGFFAEHKIQLPDATCGEAVCLHAELAVMGNMINGAHCTLLLLGMNTSLDAGALQRPPLDLVLALDTSGSMAGAPIENLRLGLQMMLPHLREEDRVSLIAFSEEATPLVGLTSADAKELDIAIAGLHANGATNIYAGLSAAYAELAASSDASRERRVLLLSDGEPTVGFLSSPVMVDLATAYSKRGMALSTIGVGISFDAELLRELATAGSGSFYFLDDPLALRDVFVEEVQTALLPLARNATIDVQVAPGYHLRNVYGLEDVKLSRSDAQLDIPLLQIAHRQSDTDADSGRRGGGGAIVVELTPDTAERTVQAIGSGEHPVGVIEFGFDPQLVVPGVTQSTERVTQRVEIKSPLPPGDTPRRGYFPSDSAEKSFVMLNLFAGMRGALEDVQFGDPQAALAKLDALQTSVEAWLSEHPDQDIAHDLEYLERLRVLIAPLATEAQPVQATSPWPVD